ncbi:hypothetical protein K443DRAFT_89971, partial [Laccaria amethystina LaAM-08-1]
NPFNELASIPNSLIQHQLFASGRKQTSHIHRSSERLRPAVWLFGHSPLPKPTQSSELLGYLIPNALSLHTWYATQWPHSLPVIRTIVVSGLRIHTA